MMRGGSSEYRFCNWQQVTSTNVEAICWHQPRSLPPASRIAGLGFLDVRFLRGRHYAYRYYDVPQSVYLEMLASPSKGRFVWYRLRDRFKNDPIDQNGNVVPR